MCVSHPDSLSEGNKVNNVLLDLILPTAEEMFVRANKNKNFAPSAAIRKDGAGKHSRLGVGGLLNVREKPPCGGTYCPFPQKAG